MDPNRDMLSEKEIEYWCEEYPDLDRSEVIEILEMIEINREKERFWRDNPTLPEDAVDKVVAENAAASYEYYLYRDLNNEAQ